MRLINCIAGVIIARTSVMFAGSATAAELAMLEQLGGRVSLQDYDECILQAAGERYRCITETILEGNGIAQNVFDMAVAQMVYPSFGGFLRKHTGSCASVENGCRLAGDNEPGINTMLEAHRLLSVLFETDDTPPFYKMEFLCDNRILAFLEGCDKDFLPHGVRLYLPEESVHDKGRHIEETFRQQLSGVIKKGNDIVIVTRTEGLEPYVVRSCAQAVEKPMVFIEAGFLERRTFDKTAAMLIREAVLYRAGIFLAGFNMDILKRLDTDGKSFILDFCDRAHKYRIPVGIGVDHELYREMKPAKRRGMELFFADSREKAGNISFYRKLSDVPFGTLVEPDRNITPDSLVIPRHQKEVLERICSHVRYEKKVYDDWGMDEKYPYGKGIPVLFAGPPGTGKTMAAYVISNMLDIPLYRVDLSQVADKYIGETEKHLQKIFDCAEENQVLLFFDEADALFGKRSEVRESKDRYANMEISYILQRIEQYDKIAILATNLRENIDAAFIRRMKYIIDFQRPDKAMRGELWRGSFSDGVPVGDIDFDFLAGQFELTGGNIKNIVLTASFLAAAKDERVGMAHIFKAVENEYYKYSKKLLPEDFGDYGWIFARNYEDTN